VVTQSGLKSPELVINGAVDNTLDIWSFGCLIFKLITGQRLYYLDPYDDEEDERDDHLLMLSDALGPLPETLYSHWTRSSRYYTPDRVQYNTLLYEGSDGQDPLANRMKPLEVFFEEYKPSDLSHEEAKSITTLIRQILHYDPSERPTPSELLQDSWFQEIR
jgi:serine/threonine protein kinase